MSAELVLGLDVGGTSTRAVLTDLAGHELGRYRAEGGNPHLHGPAEAAARIGSVVREVLAGRDPARVAACVIGLAGYRTLGEETSGFAERCRAAAGLAVPVTLCHDAEVAFAAGTEESSGVVLIAGTGAVACRIEDGRVAATAGGHGWLLGDEGSGFWLGREAARHALKGTGGLAEAVRAELGADILRAVYAEPKRLATLAPLVSGHAEAGDPAAGEIVDRAVGHLAALVREAAASKEAGASKGAVVFAGSVALTPGPVRRGLEAALPGARPAGDIPLAAARIAAGSVSENPGRP
ncbi:BadF/BadG/BcrA/BcrD ATPase family protein [Kitasatospora atroaurantiaca]|uniref:N-acetylglucosamine kinase-like BadF-type ATPase n=1 Tax=Kitasatospora atroaurantiaca TaxID=285545 RepID=A0A561ELR0_9ACTN|nr:BadF/BadG/BcrA/BcrD ATPase family protein [Kitasatospora atroaurantiaca]TWE16564.1 N-acetylglucosamine kinase-like BadF-type ATPase [Kitasatospora atroaurantiaca]